MGSLGIYVRRWENNIKMGLILDIGYGVDPTDSRQGPVTGCCEREKKIFGFHEKYGNDTRVTIIPSSRRGLLH
jgi:hypothetical protein